MEEIYVAKSGRETGPFTKDEIPRLLKSGMVESGDLVWHKGLPGWISVDQFLGLRPPLPHEAAPKPPPIPGLQLLKAVIRSGDPAPLGPRLVAHLIDTTACVLITPLIIYAVVKALMAVIAVAMTVFGMEDNPSAEVYGMWLVLTIVLLAIFLTPWFYHAWWESSCKQATPGKMACGLVVTDMEGQRLKFEQASKRALGKIGSQFLFFGILSLTSRCHETGQCPYDQTAKCLVQVK